MLRRHLHGSANFARLQSASRSGHSTETALLHVLDSVYTAADSRRSTVPSVLVGLDISSAAFDTISHDILINRLETQFGVRDSARF